MLIFLMCSERSGSNLITKIMDSHNDVCGPSPKHLFNPVVRNAFRYEPLSDRENWSALLTDIGRLLDVPFSQWKSSLTLDTLSELAPPGDLPCLLRNVALEEARAHGKEHCFIKENQVYELISFLLTHFPDARFLYLVRDPRDVALSWARSRTHMGGIVHGAQQWKKDQQQFMKDHATLRGVGRSRMIRYEEMITDPESVIPASCEFFGLPFDPGMLNFHEKDLTRRNATNVSAWENLRKPVMRDNHGKYRSAMSPEDIALVEYICLPEMYALGYEFDTSVDELEAISGRSVEMALRHEKDNFPAEPEPGVRANMAAKRVFYQKCLGRIAE
ncbi:sulfotransferase family protein [Arhodomonas sp. AD133]|uniref:sulfotransferase family protein n=1 Tax=Arhodomonas sp. AD133 TaxID=3415009 RepID=UPI003EBE3AFD